MEGGETPSLPQPVEKTVHCYMCYMWLYSESGITLSHTLLEFSSSALLKIFFGNLSINTCEA